MRGLPLRSRCVVALALASAAACEVDAAVADDVADEPGTTGASAGTEGTTDADDTTDVGGSSGPPADSSTSAADDDDGPKLDLAVPDAALSDECELGTDVVHVLFENEGFPLTYPELHRLPLADLDDLAFEHVLTLDCLGLDDQGNPRRAANVSIDRDGYALVYDYENLQRIDINAAVANCEEVPLSPLGIANPLLSAFAVLDPDDPDSERLFTHGDIGQNIGGVPLPGEFGWIDLSMSPAPKPLLGMTPYIISSLVGTGDGRLYGMGSIDGDAGGGDIPEELAQFDPANGEVLEVFLTMETLMFPAFYAGDLILIDRGITDDSASYVSSVRLFDLDDDDGNGEHELVDLAGDEIFPATLVPIGAASPTCIPLTPEG